MRVLDVDGREVHSAIKGDTKNSSARIAPDTSKRVGVDTWSDRASLTAPVTAMIGDAVAAVIDAVVIGAA
jgi:hypothetical protein